MPPSITDEDFLVPIFDPCSVLEDFLVTDINYIKPVKESMLNNMDSSTPQYDHEHMPVNFTLKFFERRQHWILVYIGFLPIETDFPPDLSSTRIESDFCSSIIAVQRISPLRLFKIRQNLEPITFPSL